MAMHEANKFLVITAPNSMATLYLLDELKDDFLGIPNSIIMERDTEELNLVDFLHFSDYVYKIRLNADFVLFVYVEPAYREDDPDDIPKLELWERDTIEIHVHVVKETDAPLSRPDSGIVSEQVEDIVREFCGNHDWKF